MTPDEICSEVDAAYGDWTGRAVPHLTDLVPFAIAKGADTDADFVFLAAIIDGHVRCGIVWGCSLLVGAGMRWAVIRYAGEDRLLGRLTEETAAALSHESVIAIPVRGNDEHWRGFRGERLLSFQERLARVRRDLN
jgi:hypothetical protein